MIARLFAALAGIGLRWPALVVGGLVALTLAAVVGVRGFAIEPDVSRMLPDSPEVRMFRELEQRTAGGRTLLIAVAGQGVRDVEARLARLAVSLRESEFLERVDVTRAELLGAGGIASLPAPLWSLSAAGRARVQARLTTDRRATLGRLLDEIASDPLGGRDLALADPLDLRGLLAEAATAAMPVPLSTDTECLILADGSVGVLRTVGKRPPYDVDFARALLADVETRLADTECDLWGGYVVAREQAGRMQGDLIWSSVSSSFFVGLYLAWVLGNWLAPILVLLPTCLAILWALPLASALFGPFNVIAVGAAAVLVGLGVDFSVHYLARYGVERPGASHRVATARTASAVGVPILLGVLTTVGAFLSLAAGEFAGLAGFGALLALGLVLALLLTFVLTPLLLAWPRLGRLKTPASSVARVGERVVDSRFGWVVAWLLVALGVGGWVETFGHGLRFDVGADALSPRSSAASATRAHLEQKLGFSPLPVTLLVDPAQSPANLESGLAALREAGLVAFVDGPQLSLAGAATRAHVAEVRQAAAGFVAAARLDLEDLGFEASEFEASLRRWEALLLADPGPVAARFLVDAADGPRAALFCYLRHGVRSEPDWDHFKAAVRTEFGDAVACFGSYTLMRRVREVLLHDLRTCALASLAIVLAVTLLLLRGHWLGLLAMVPVLLGTGITMGLLSFLDVPLNLANFVVVPFLIGIGVDDGIHLASRMGVAGVHAALGETGVAVWRTSATTALAFGSLVASTSPGLASLGLIALIGVLASWASSVLVFVPFARWVGRGSRPAISPSA